MAARKKKEEPPVIYTADQQLLITLDELMQRTGLGRPLAQQLADEAAANVYVGRKHLFSPDKIRQYCISQAV